MAWTPTDLVALSRLGRLESHDRIGLVTTQPSLEAALAAIGAADIGLRDEAERILSDADLHGVQIVTWADAAYPELLRQIANPPLILYVLGTLPAAQPGIAVVGTRSCTVQYGKPATEKLVEPWVRAGCSIISGLAAGIDTLAHEAALRWKGATVAVIASGIGRITPKSARALSERIAEHGGAVVSEHPFHVAALPPYFPARNRIIVGLSKAVVVVESKDTGGALITAAFATQAQRPLWSVPGPITSSRSIGTNALIAAGTARMLRCAEDVLADLQIASEPAVVSPLPADLEAMGADAFDVDAAAARWQTTPSDASVRLLQYELSGQVEQLPGARYRAK